MKYYVVGKASIVFKDTKVANKKDGAASLDSEKLKKNFLAVCASQEKEGNKGEIIVHKTLKEAQEVAQDLLTSRDEKTPVKHAPIFVVECDKVEGEASVELYDDKKVLGVVLKTKNCKLLSANLGHIDPNKFEKEIDLRKLEDKEEEAEYSNRIKKYAIFVSITAILTTLFSEMGFFASAYTSYILMAQIVAAAATVLITYYVVSALMGFKMTEAEVYKKALEAEKAEKSAHEKELGYSEKHPVVKALDELLSEIKESPMSENATKKPELYSLELLNKRYKELEAIAKKGKAALAKVESHILKGPSKWLSGFDKMEEKAKKPRRV